MAVMCMCTLSERGFVLLVRVTVSRAMVRVSVRIRVWVEMPVPEYGSSGMGRLPIPQPMGRTGMGCSYCNKALLKIPASQVCCT